MKKIKLNNKGYLLVEIIVAAALAMTVAWFLTDLTIKLKNKNDDEYVETVLIINKSLMTQAVMDDLDKYSVAGIEVSNKMAYVHLSDSEGNQITKIISITQETDPETGKVTKTTFNYYPDTTGMTAEEKKDAMNSIFTKDFSDNLVVGGLNITCLNNDCGTEEGVLTISIPAYTLYSDSDYGLNLVIPYNSKIKISAVRVGNSIDIDPSTGLTCTNYDSSNSENHTNTGCLRWYIYKDNGDNSFQLLLDHNISEPVAWNSDGSNTTKKDVQEKFDEVTKAWKSDLNTRLITADEIAEITGKKSYFDSTTSTSANGSFHFDTDVNNENNTCSKETPSGCKYVWLYNYLYECNNFGCTNSAQYSDKLYGYWTDTAVNGSNEYIWYIASERMGYTSAKDSTSCGIRPVVTYKISN